MSLDASKCTVHAQKLYLIDKYNVLSFEQIRPSDDRNGHFESAHGTLLYYKSPDLFRSFNGYPSDRFIGLA